MNHTDTPLPTGFESLQPFVGSWTGATVADRSKLRLAGTEESRALFVKTVAQLAPSALAYLDTKPLSELNDSEQLLLNLLLSFIHISQAVEIQRDAEPGHATLRQHFVITRAPADEPPAQHR